MPLYQAAASYCKENKGVTRLTHNKPECQFTKRHTHFSVHGLATMWAHTTNIPLSFALVDVLLLVVHTTMVQTSVVLEVVYGKSM